MALKRKGLIFIEPLNANCTLHKNSDDVFEIEWAEMYEAPTLTFALLRALADYYGTELIHIDSIAKSGCETCDYGSLYGHRILVEKATKNTPDITP